MKILMFLFLIIIYFMNLACGCKKDSCKPSKSHYYINITNQSSVSIYYQFNWIFSDTNLSIYSPMETQIPVIKSGESYKAPIGGKRPREDCLEKIFDDYPKAWVYFLNADTVLNLPWEKVRQTYRGVLERREITLDYLQNNSFTVVYP